MRDVEPLNYNGIPYSKIIEAWLEGVNLDNNRHNTLTELASHLRYLIGKNPKKITEVVMQQKWVQDLSAEGEDVAGTVGSVMGWRYNQKMPEQLQKALEKVGISQKGQIPAGAPTRSLSPSCDDIACHPLFFCGIVWNANDPSLVSLLV